jgi:hypothetical protein
MKYLKRKTNTARGGYPCYRNLSIIQFFSKTELTLKVARKEFRQ